MKDKVLSIKALPTHVVLDEKGNEIGTRELVWLGVVRNQPDFDELDPTADFREPDPLDREAGMRVFIPRVPLGVRQKH